MESTLLSLVNVTKSFKQGDKSLVVLKQVNLSCIQGQTYALMGPSGSGKSTLIQLLAGLDKPTQGQLLYNGEDLFQLQEGKYQFFRQKVVGLLFQQPYLLSELTVLENAMLPGLIAGQSSKECQAIALELLDAVGLSDKVMSHPASLSGGQQQRAALARALINKPAFLIADEPTGNLDEKTGREIVALIQSLQKAWHMAVMVSTHDSYVGHLMETIFHLDQGYLTVGK